MSIGTSTEEQRLVLRSAAVKMERATQPLAENANITDAQVLVLDPLLAAVRAAMVGAGVDMGSDATLQMDLASVAGAGLVGFDSAEQYPEGTLGAAVSSVDARAEGILADGSDETAKVLAIAAKFKNTGKTLRHTSGTIKITAAVAFEGFIWSSADSAQIQVHGDSSAPFMGGAIITNGTAVFQGGIVFTTGNMPATLGSKLIRQNSGRVYGVTAYCQLDEVVSHVSGYLDIMMYGGKSRGVRSTPTMDIALSYNINWYNVGMRYVNKVVVPGVPTDSRAFHINPQVAITQPVLITGNADHCWKNAFWIGGTTAPMTNVTVTLNVNRAGYYINEAGVEVAGHGAGTAIEIENCPGAKLVNCVTTKPRGYNVAFVGGSHGAQLIGGAQYGAGGDPVVVITNSDSTEIGGLLTDGTVGVSVGEGTVVNNTRVTATIRNMSAAPMTFFAGSGFHFTGSISGEPVLASYTGSWTGPGEVKVMLMCFGGANDVTWSPVAVQGWFTHDVVDRSAIPGRLRVNRSGPYYAAPILSRNDISLDRFSRESSSARFTRVLSDVDTAGHAGVGELTLPSGGASFNSWLLATSMVDMTDFDIVGTDLPTVRNKYALLVYMKYVPGALSKRIGFSLNSGTGVTAQQATIFYGTFGAPITTLPGDNSIMGKLHNLADGEWVPLVIPLNSVIQSGSVEGALTRFMVWKMDDPTTFDLTITKPVLVYLGTPAR